MKNIVICGSMKVKDRIIEISKELEKKRIQRITTSRMHARNR